MGIAETKRIHPVWKEVAGTSACNMFGKYQYIFSSEKGEISLIELPNYWRDGKTIWEILCVEGDLFDDVERFDSFKEAKARVKKFLKPKEHKGPGSIRKTQEPPTYSITIESKGQELVEHMVSEINKALEMLDKEGVKVRISIPKIGQVGLWKVKAEADYSERDKRVRIRALRKFKKDIKELSKIADNLFGESTLI